MSDVFLSYSREDREQASRFAQLLTDAGLTVWWDLEIPPGKTWDQVIGKALGEAKCVVVLWTETSVASDWVKEEASRGARRGALVPVLLDAIEPPLGFGRIEAAELAGWKGDTDDAELRNFLAAVQELVETPIELPPPRPARGGAGLSRKTLLTVGAVLIGSVVGWLVWKSLGSPTEELAIKIWAIEVDRKGPVEAARSFATDGGEPGAALDAAAARIVEWITEKVVPTDVSTVLVHLVVPEDPTTDRIRLESEPAIELQTYLYISADRGKSRVPSQLRPEDLAFAGLEFAIEIAATGYDSIPVPVVVGEAQDRSFELKPMPIKLAVEELLGRPNHFATRLTELLSADPRVRALGPEALEELRLEIERSRAGIGVNRAAQVALRDSLGVDYIIGGELGSP